MIICHHRKEYREKINLKVKKNINIGTLSCLIFLGCSVISIIFLFFLSFFMPSSLSSFTKDLNFPLQLRHFLSLSLYLSISLSISFSLSVSLDWDEWKSYPVCTELMHAYTLGTLIIGRNHWLGAPKITPDPQKGHYKLHVKEVLTHLYSTLLYKMGQDFLDIQH